MNFPALVGLSGVRLSPPAQLLPHLRPAISPHAAPGLRVIALPLYKIIRGDNAYIPKGNTVYPEAIFTSNVENTSETWAEMGAKAAKFMRIPPSSIAPWNVNNNPQWLPALVHSTRRPAR